jgi:uncharacterized membrane protein
MSLFTEIIVSVYLYMLLCLTDFMGKASMIRDALALTLVYIIGFAVFVNLMIFAKLGFYKVKLCIKKRMRARIYEIENQKRKIMQELDKAEGSKLPDQPWHLPMDHLGIL